MFIHPEKEPWVLPHGQLRNAHLIMWIPTTSRLSTRRHPPQSNPNPRGAFAPRKKVSEQRGCHPPVEIRDIPFAPSIFHPMRKTHIKRSLQSLIESRKHPIDGEGKTINKSLFALVSRVAGNGTVQPRFGTYFWTLGPLWQLGHSPAHLAVGQNQWYHFGVGEFTTHFSLF